MNEISARVAMANVAIKKLNDLHVTFLDFIGTRYGNEQTPIGELKVSGNSISIVCLGVKLRSLHKLILKSDGSPLAIEYLFVLKDSEPQKIIFKMYLSFRTSALLSIIDDEESSICWSKNDQNLAETLLNAIAEKMLDSDMFIPSES